MKHAPSPWRESEFERWFMRKPFLPDGSRVLVVGRQSSLRHVVDLLALDATGGLVLIEVKNEKSTRTVIGQSLEYLAQYTDIAVEDLEEDYARLRPTSSLEADFRSTFNRDLTVTQKRRVYVVAPSFDLHSAVCVRYLEQRLLGGGVTFSLIRARRAGSTFRIEVYECPEVRPARSIKQGFAMTPGGRLFHVLEPGRQPVMWYIGKRIVGGGLRLASDRALARRSLQVLTRMLIPTESAEQVDVSQSGTVWQHSKKPGTRAKLLGQVLADDAHPSQQRFAVIARFANGRFERFQKKPWSELAAGWRKVGVKLPDWRTVVAAAR